MCRRKCCVGVGLMAFGAGLLAAVIFQSTLFLCLLGLGCIGAGIWCMG
jgi:hypothetical protein